MVLENYMAIELWKFQLEGYLIRDPRGRDDPNDIDLSAVISEVIRNPFVTTIVRVDAIEEAEDDKAS